MDIIGQIAKKLEVAYFYGYNSRALTIIRLIFKPGEDLTEEEERLLLELMKKEVEPEQTYVCCNRAWQPGKIFEAFFHLHHLDVERETYKLLVKKFKVR